MNRAATEKARSVILSVLDTSSKPMKTAEIAAHASARKFSSRTIGQLLKSMDGVTYDRAAKRWKSSKQRPTITVVKEPTRLARIADAAQFTGVVFSRSRQQVFFKIGDAEFPFTIID